MLTDKYVHRWASDLSRETAEDNDQLTLKSPIRMNSRHLILIYILRKFGKKGKGFKPGSVTVEREKSLWIEVKEDQLKRLKGGTN